MKNIIQQGHMKMHLANILNQLGATDEQKAAALVHFKDVTVTYAGVEEFLKTTNTK